VHEISIVYARAALAISAVLVSPEGSGLIRHGAVVEKIAQCSGLDGEIDVLRNVARRLDHAQRTSFALTTPTMLPLASCNGPPLLPG